jgi:hypothetical protein
MPRDNTPLDVALGLSRQSRRRVEETLLGGGGVSCQVLGPAPKIFSGTLIHPPPRLSQAMLHAPRAIPERAL